MTRSTDNYIPPFCGRIYPRPPSSASRKWCENEGWVAGKERKKVRCPDCNKVVIPRQVHCIGGELVGFKIPPHKTKPKTYKRQKGDRGKRHGLRTR